MKAIIMAGGEGSRLRPLTCDCPKPMLRLMGKPLMEYALRLLKQHGVTEIGATLAYLPDAVMDYFGDGADFGVNLHYYIEKTPLGTAGSVKQAQEFLNERFIVLSGDGVTDFDLNAALDFHIKNDAAATLILKKCPNPQEYGMVVTDADGRIRSFHEKPGRSDVFSDRINTGIYILEPELLRRIPNGCPFDFGHDFFPALLQAEASLYGYTASGYWCDVGDVPAYLRVHMDAMEGKIHLDGLADKSGVHTEGATLDKGCILDAPCFIGKGAHIASGAHIGPYSVVGENCRVAEAANIKRSVLFDHVQIDVGAQLRGCVAAANTVVGEGAQLFEDSVVGSGSSVGARATLPPGVKLWPGKAIPDGERPDGNVVWGSRREQRFVGGGLHLENPVQAARAAQACVAELKPRELLMGRTLSTVAHAMWHSAAAGAMAQGVQLIDAGVCTLPQLRHAQRMLHADAAMLVEESAMIPLGADGALLTEKTQRAILKLHERQDFACPFSTPAKPIQEAGRSDAAYIAHAASAFTADPQLVPPVALFCQSSHLLQLADQTFARAGLRARCEWDARNMQLLPDEIGLYLSEDGLRAYFATQDGRIDDARRELLIAWTAIHQGEKRLILHNSATRAIDILAGKHNVEPLYLSGEQVLWMHTLAENAYPQFLLHFDALYSALSSLSALAKSKLSLAQWLEQSPHVCRRTRAVQVPPSQSGRLLHGVASRASQAELGGGVRLVQSEGWLWICPDERRPELNIMAEAMSMEAAEGMCDFIETQLRRLMED